MHYITLDTNTWIYLANGTEPVRILNFIVQETRKGNITILLPKLIIEEWERNKVKHVAQGSLQHFKDIQVQLARIKKLFDNEKRTDVIDFLFEEDQTEQIERDVLIEYIDQFKKKRQSIEKAVKQNIELIDELFKTDATIIEIDIELYVKAGNAALAKKAPFHKHKNSFADALIVFSFLDYVEKNNIIGAQFISYNVEDFCEKADGENSLHSDLITEFVKTKSEFHKIVGLAIQTIKEDIISQEELQYIEDWQREMDEQYDEDMHFCEVCSDVHDRPSVVYFSDPVQLDDNRLESEINSSQLNIDFDDGHEPSPKRSHNSIVTGSCEYCSTEHFICVECSEINAVEEYNFNVPYECLGCGLVYFIEYTYDHDGTEWKDYTIPQKLFKCEKCGGEFNDDQMNENLCLDCEDEYSYGS